MFLSDIVGSVGWGRGCCTGFQLPPHMGLVVIFCVILASESGVDGVFLLTSWGLSLDFAGATAIVVGGFSCKMWASEGEVLCVVMIVAGFRGVCVPEDVSCGHSHSIRLITSLCWSLGLAGAMAVGSLCVMCASKGGVLWAVFIVPWFWDVGPAMVVSCEHSHSIRLTGPLLIASRRSLCLAHSLTLTAAWWHFSIPAESKFAGGGNRSLIIWALCRWTITLMEAGSGSVCVRLSFSQSLALPASLASGF